LGNCVGLINPPLKIEHPGGRENIFLEPVEYLITKGPAD